VSQKKSKANTANGTMTPTYNKTVSNSHESKLTSNLPSAHATMSAQANGGNSKKQMRFQCRFCAYKSHSVSLMQNHIYRHIDTTPYSCFYCGHKSTTKSTIMVHIELCHPNMEVKIKESRVREEDYYLDLNSSSSSASNTASQMGNELNKLAKSVPKGFKSNQANPEDKFEIIANKCSNKRKHEDECHKPSMNNQLNTSSNPSSTLSSPSTYSSPSISPVQTSTLTTVAASGGSKKAPKSKEELNENFIQLQNPNMIQMEGDEEQMGDANSNGNYVTVFNRPKQYFGSLYEPDKQYSCKLCTYTTNHKPSMEDHVYVHTNKRPYR
jgi:DNA-directed RNA polymerase subunit M/transcription elongation factor TFIIS